MNHLKAIFGFAAAGTAATAGVAYLGQILSPEVVTNAFVAAAGTSAVAHSLYAYLQGDDGAKYDAYGRGCFTGLASLSGILVTIFPRL